MDIEAQLRHKAKASGLSIKALADAAGLHYASLHGFVNGRSLALASAAKLARALGLELVERRRTQKGR